MSRSVLAYAVLSSALLSLNASAARTPTVTPGAQVTAKLKSGNDASISEAESQMRQWFSAGQVSPDTFNVWLPALMGAERYWDVANLALSAALASPDSVSLEHLMVVRSQAFLALKMPQDALQAAKVAYCFSGAKELAANVNRMAACLALCHPEDSNIAQQFKTEQAVGAMSGSGNGPAMAFFQSIKIEGTVYESALQQWKMKADGGKFSQGIFYGNLLIAAGRGEMAEAVFRKLFQSALTEGDLDLATQSIVRSLRAQDGNDSRGNAWLVALQKHL